MQIVYIDSGYTDFLRTYDARVSYNENVTYQRPYVGVLLNVQTKKYFAPLTTSNKGKKLKNNPKPENVTFLPIDNCKYGGVNFNNMIPVIDGVYVNAELTINKNDDPFIKNKKVMLQNISRFLRKNNDKIIIKAKNLYNLKNSKKLYPNYDAITCDFKELEKAAMSYNDNAKISSQQNLLQAKYKLTDKQLATVKRFYERELKENNDIIMLEKAIRSAINAAERSEIANGQRGHCFLISGARERTSFQVTADQVVADLFSTPYTPEQIDAMVG